MLLVYDGQCGFCIRSACWIEARLPDGARVEPWQSLDLNALGLTRQQAQTAVWWLEHHDSRAERCSGAKAIGRALSTAGGAWGFVGWFIAHPPLYWLARPVYAMVAANRHRLPGST